MKSDYKNWLLENNDFLNHLSHHNSVLHLYIKDVIISLNYIDALEENEVDADMREIFDTGYAYLYNFVEELKIILENYYQNDFHKFLENDSFIHYYMYVSEIRDVLIDDNVYNEIVKEQFEYILEKIELILQGNLENNLDLIDEFNERMMSVMPMKKAYLTISDIFVEVLDRLKI